MSEVDEPSPPLDTSTFDFHGALPGPFVDVILSNTERAQLRALAEPGGPLLRIVQGLLDYKVVVERAFGLVDLFAPDGLQKVASLQAEVKAITWQIEMWQRHLTFMPPELSDEDQGS